MDLEKIYKLLLSEDYSDKLIAINMIVKLDKKNFKTFVDTYLLSYDMDNSGPGTNWKWKSGDKEAHYLKSKRRYYYIADDGFSIDTKEQAESWGFEIKKL